MQNQRMLINLINQEHCLAELTETWNQKATDVTEPVWLMIPTKNHSCYMSHQTANLTQ
jgi:hypothetical protein